MAYSDIDKPSDYFNTSLWTGNGATQSITGVGFQPDWVWIKARTGTYSGSDHHIYDVIRGANAKLSSNSTGGSATISDTLTSFDSDGYSLGFRTRVNGTGTTYAGWNWLAGGTASSNTDGSITSSVSANTTSGFSIVSYTGTGSAATIGHSLGVKPSMIITKRRDSTSNWMVYHSSLGATKYLQLETTDQANTSSTRWNNTEPTSSVFTVGTSSGTNPSSGTMIAYCFAEKKGFRKFGSYTGNGSTDGTFVYTGFKPAFLITKRTNASGNSWILTDSARDTDNVVQKVLYPDGSNAEASSDRLDFLSNGFKQRTTSAAANGSGDTYIYMCFASNPFVTSSGIPVTAR